MKNHHIALFEALLFRWLFVIAAVTTKSVIFCHAFSYSSSATLCFHRGRSQPIGNQYGRAIETLPSTYYHYHSNHSTRLHLAPEVFIGGGVLIAGLAGWLYVDGADDRQRRNQRQEEEERYREYQEGRSRQAYIEPKDFWTEAELAEYDGTKDPDGPILMAADGLVFNVYKGRNFYGPGGEYHLFAGRNVTRLLAKTIVVEEPAGEVGKPLNMGERASLAAWVFTFKGKYEIVGKLEGFDPKTTSMKSLGS
jgi:membrane-associated progesterone receptor component